VAAAAAKAGQFKAVLKAAGRVTDPGLRSKSYAAVALVAAGNGSVEIAKEAADQIPNEWLVEQSAAWAAVAQSLARDGRFYDARVYCEGCERPDKLVAYIVIHTEHTKQHAHHQR
jgi:hypothetical protein